MSPGPRFSVDATRERIVVCDFRPACGPSTRWGTPGLWRDVETRTGVRSIFELPAPECPTPRRSGAGWSTLFDRRIRRGTTGLGHVFRELLAGGREHRSTLESARDGARSAPRSVGGPETALETALETGPETGPESGSGSRSAPAPAARCQDALRQAALDWAIATADGELEPDALGGWTAPAAPGGPGGCGRGLDWFPFLLATSRGPLSSEVHWTDRRISISVPVVVELPGRLGAARRGWVDALCRDIHARWVYVRVDVRHADGPARARGPMTVSAEVDLTGCPHELLPRLAFEAHDALTVAVEQLQERLAIVADPQAASRLLSRAPQGTAWRAQRRNPSPSASPGEASLSLRQSDLPW